MMFFDILLGDEWHPELQAHHDDDEFCDAIDDDDSQTQLERCRPSNKVTVPNCLHYDGP